MSCHKLSASTREMGYTYTYRKLPFSTGRRGHVGSCLCMKCNIIIDF